MVRPLRDVDASLTNTRLSLGDGTLAGRSRIATPYDPRRLRRAVQSTAGSASRPVGELVAVAGTAVAIAGAGTTLFGVAETVQQQSGFVQVDTAGDVPTLPVLGSYVVEVDVRWTDGYRGGGTVEVLADGSPIPEAWPSGTTDEPWGRWADVVTFIGERGQTCDVRVTPDDAGAHTADVTVRLAVVETLRTISVASATPPATATIAHTSNGGPGTTSWTVDINYPTCSVGDLLVACQSLSNWNSGGSLSVPSGWTTVITTSSGGHHGFIAYKIADAADAAQTATHTMNATTVTPQGGLDQTDGQCVAIPIDGASIGSPTVVQNGYSDLASDTYTGSAFAGGSYGLVVAHCRNLAQAGSRQGFVDPLTGDVTEVIAGGNGKADTGIGTVQVGGVPSATMNGTISGSLWDALVVLPMTGGG